ncbi:MAG: hypothetical protein ACE5LL_02585, partial [Alphaproteobacteria bacterium]
GTPDALRGDAARPVEFTTLSWKYGRGVATHNAERYGVTARALNVNPYETGLDRGAANYVPLTPVSFLTRAAAVYPDR